MTTEKGFWGSGWTFPPTFDSSNNQLMISHGEENIRQSINTILNTQRGERSVIPDWGIDLNTFKFKKMDANLKGRIISSVKHGLLRFEPRISVENITIEGINGSGSKIGISINYIIHKTNTRHNHVHPFSEIEGTNLVAK